MFQWTSRCCDSAKWYIQEMMQLSLNLIQITAEKWAKTLQLIIVSSTIQQSVTTVVAVCVYSIMVTSYRPQLKGVAILLLDCIFCPDFR
jgi:hypothetical protein